MLKAFNGINTTAIHTAPVAHILEVGYQLYPHPVQTEEHDHGDAIEMVFIQSGDGIITCNDEKYTATTGDLLIYEAGAQHSEYWYSSLDPLILLYIQSNARISFGYAADAALPAQLHILHTGTFHAQVSRILWTIYREMTGKRADHEQICDHLLACLMLLIRRINEMEYVDPDQPAQVSLAAQIRSYIDSQCTAVQLKDLSDRFHMSIYHLSHVFREEVGVSPIRYANQQRIERAKLMLRTTMYTISEIAQSVGFDNTPNFNHMFKSYTGMTPVEYRSG